MFCTSSSRDSIILDLVQVMARPTISDSASALITFMSAGISSWKSTSGSSRRPSTCDTIDRCGMSAVSYTHLDVYKRQARRRSLWLLI